jgi:hypothetical protein
MRVVLWVICGLILALVPLGVVALMDWDPNKETFLHVFTNEELLAVAFTLGGASGVDALSSASPVRWISRVQKTIGASTIVCALLTASLYIVFRTGLHNLSITQTRLIEISIFILCSALALFSEIAAT